MSVPESYALPAKLDLLTAASLAEGLDARRGKPLVLDAKEVTHLGTPGLQVVLSACKTWEEDGISLTLENFSEALETQLEPLGLARSDLVPSGASAAPEDDAITEVSDDAPALPDLSPDAPEEGAPAPDLLGREED